MNKLIKAVLILEVALSKQKVSKLWGPPLRVGVVGSRGGGGVVWGTYLF
jgi:hypothetical protein